MALVDEIINRIKNTGLQMPSSFSARADTGVKLALDRARDERKRTMTELHLGNSQPRK